MSSQSLRDGLQDASAQPRLRLALRLLCSLTLSGVTGDSAKAVVQALRSLSVVVQSVSREETRADALVAAGLMASAARALGAALLDDAGRFVDAVVGEIASVSGDAGAERESAGAGIAEAVTSLRGAHTKVRSGKCLGSLPVPPSMPWAMGTSPRHEDASL